MSLEWPAYLLTERGHNHVRVHTGTALELVLAALHQLYQTVNADF